MVSSRQSALSGSTAGVLLGASSPGIPCPCPSPSPNVRLLLPSSLEASWKRSSSTSQLPKQPVPRHRTPAGGKLLPQRSFLRGLLSSGPGLPLLPAPCATAVGLLRAPVGPFVRKRSPEQVGNQRATRQESSIPRPAVSVLPPFCRVRSFVTLQGSWLGLLGKAAPCPPSETAAQRCGEQRRIAAQPPRSQRRQDRGLRETLPCCKPARFHRQPNFTSKEASSSSQVTLETKPSALPDAARTTVPTPTAHRCGAGFAAARAQACCSHPGTSSAAQPCSCGWFRAPPKASPLPSCKFVGK